MKASRYSRIVGAALGCGLLVAPLAAAGALPVSSYLSPKTIAALAGGSGLRDSSVGSAIALTLSPDHPAARQMAVDLAAENPDVVVEALFLWKKPRHSDPAAEQLQTYNILRSVGSLAGIEYYSASRKKMRLFYEASSLVSGPDGETTVADRILTALPRTETLYARQKDLSFGDNINRLELSSGEDYVRSLSINLTTMRYGILPVAGAGDLRVRALIIIADDAIIFYAVSSARATIIPGVRGKLESSFGNRAEAIYTWFSRKAEESWARLP